MSTQRAGEPRSQPEAPRPTYAQFHPLSTPGYMYEQVYTRSKRTTGLLDVLVVTGLIGLGVGAGIYASRAPALRAVILGLTAALALFTLLRLTSDANGVPISRWRPPTVTRSLRALARRWQFTRFDRLTGPSPALVTDVRERMRAVIGAELARRDVEFDSDGARAMLGPRVHELLSGPVNGRVTAGQLQEIIVAAAALCPPTATPERTRTSPRGKKGTAA